MVDQVHSGGKWDESSIPPVIKRPMTEEEREMFRKILAQSYRIDLSVDDSAIIIEYDGNYIEYKMKVKNVTNNSTVYKRIFRCFNVEGGTGMIVSSQPDRKSLYRATAPRKK